MGLMLKKGQRIKLLKEEGGLNNLLVTLGWDTNRYYSIYDFDLDVSVFMCNREGLVQNASDFIFYNNLKHESESVQHLGEEILDAKRRQQKINVNLNKIPDYIEKLVITITIYDAIERGQNFGQVDMGAISVFDKDSGEELIVYDLSEEYSIETSLIACEIYKYKGVWKFKAVGCGIHAGLDILCKNYGLSV